MAAVTVGQPGQGTKGQDMVLTAPPGTVVQMPGNLPPGLAYLASLDDVKIHQHFDTLEVVTGFERNNKYRICNNADQQFLYAKENTSCLTRQFCGPARPFEMNITDNQGMHLMQLIRPFRCHGYWGWCCYLMEMDIQSPPGVSIGGIRQVWTCWKPHYEIHDASGKAIFTIHGDCCFCMPCTDIEFQVLDMDGKDVGRITKHWGGCREIFGGVNDFSVNFPVHMDVMQKALLVGSTFLIDFVFFERNKS